MRIGLLQMHIVSGEKERNIHHAFQLMEEAAPQSDLLVLPELWTVGYDFRHIRDQATQMGDPLVERLEAFARVHHLTIAAGTLPVVMGNQLWNMALVFGPTGAIQAHYEKRRLFEAYLEGELMTPGTHSVQTEIRGIKSGIAVCYELYFPHMFLDMAINETTLVIVPASWPIQSITRWEILSRARAIENGMYICAVNMVGEYHGIQFGGHSLLVDPEGNVVTSAGEGEEICYGHYDETRYKDLGKGLAVIRPAKQRRREGEGEL